VHPYLWILRKRIVRSIESGLSRRGTAARFAVSESCAIKLMQVWRRTGSVAPTRPYALAGHEKLVRDLVSAHPDMTPGELHAGLTAAGVVVGRTLVHRYLEALGLTLKKDTPRRRAGAAGRRAARQACCESQSELEPERLIFIDETWVKTNMARLYGRAPRGQRLIATVPHGRWQTSLA
jgi:transposase